MGLIRYFCTRMRPKAMRTVIYTLLAFSLVVTFAACDGGGLSAEEKARVQSLEGLPRVDYAKGGVAFSLGQVEGLRPTHRDSVPWASYLAENDSNGQVAYYFFPGYAVELGSPQIRIEYMHKGLKGCGSVDSLFSWLKGLFIEPRAGKVRSEAPIGTLDGQEIMVLEIETPPYISPDSTQYAPKWMAWAYADHGDRFVGFSFTATDADGYKQGIEPFKDLVRSYRDNQD